MTQDFKIEKQKKKRYGHVQLKIIIFSYQLIITTFDARENNTISRNFEHVI